VIEAIRLLQSGKLVKADEKNWKFGQKKTIIPTELGSEIRTLMEDLDRYNNAYSRFVQTQEHFDHLITYPSVIRFKDFIEVDDHSGSHKVKTRTNADNLVIKSINANRSKLKSKGWTNEEINLHDGVSHGLFLVKTFCVKSIFSAIAHRYAFTFHRFDLGKNEIATNILTEVIVNELKGQLSNLLSEGSRKGSERENEYDTIDRMYYVMYNQIADPILRDLEDVLDIERYRGSLAEKMKDTKKICHSLLFNRFVSAEVKNVISCLLMVLHHYTRENSTPLIDRTRTFQRANSMSGMRKIDEELRLKRKKLSRNEKLGLIVAKKHNSMIEHWFRRDDEGDSDENSLWSSINIQPTSLQHISKQAKGIKVMRSDASIVHEPDVTSDNTSIS
jgi:hypothetical protein